jgi:hypothetical protein
MAATGHVNLTSSDGLVAQHALGEEFESNGNRYKYVKSGAAINAYRACVVTYNGMVATEATVPLNAQESRLYVIPQFAIAATDEYFWAPVGPFFLKDDGTSFKVTASAAAGVNVKLYIAATGKVDDAGTYAISGLVLSTAATGADQDVGCVAYDKLLVNC